MKEEFEKNHFIIRSPLQYICMTNKNFSSYNKRDFMDLVAPYQLDNKPFFNEWLKDTERASFNQIEFNPDLENADHENFNTFTGFKSKKINNPNMEKVNKFLELLKLLTNYDEKSTNYLIKYIAHMFQKPGELPLTAILIKSEQGAGKDLMLDILAEIINKDFTHKDEKMENVIGKFNSSSQGKLFILFNEVQGSNGHFNKEALKDLITKKILNTRKMRTDIIKDKNFCRVFLFSNNLNPIDIPPGDRRYVVFKAGNKKDKAFYNPLVNFIKYNDKEALDSIYTYFMNYDISNFEPSDPKDRVITKAYTDSQKHNTNPFYEFLHEMINDPEKHKIINKGDNNYIMTKYTEHFYSKFLDRNNFSHITSNQKNNKAVLLDLGAEDKKFYINKKQVRGYQINITELKENIKKFYNEDNEELIDLDLDIDDSFLDDTDDEE